MDGLWMISISGATVVVGAVGREVGYVVGYVAGRAE